ncbi:MAG: ATP-binding protein [Chitinispirillaceae bacterium]
MLDILLVEDNPADARLLMEELSDLPNNPLNIIHVQTLRDAFGKLKSAHYDAVLLDLNLPDSDGAQTIRKVHDHSPSLPVVVLTGVEDERTESEAVMLGADDFLVKGETPAKMFLRSIRYSIDRKRMSGLREKYLRDTSVLVRISTDVLASETIRKLLQVISSGARELTGSSCSIALLNENSHSVRFSVSCNDEYTSLSDLKSKPMAAFLFDRIRIGRLRHFSPAELRGSSEWLEGAKGNVPERGVSVVSLFDREMSLTGALVVFDTGQECFSSEYEAVLGQLATMASLALQHLEARGQAQGKARELEVQKQELEYALSELESFTYSVSHDLRGPLRSISSFSSLVSEECGESIREAGKEYLSRIENAAQKMGDLIDDLLFLSRVTRQELLREEISLSGIVSSVVDDLRKRDPRRDVQVDIQKGVEAWVDPRLATAALTNIIENSWKFTSRTEDPRIGFGMEKSGNEKVYYIRDNGVGFDSRYVQKIFMPFQRLHKATDFPGTGIGLAIVERVIRRHGGRLWAESSPGKGATVYFTFGAENNTR